METVWINSGGLTEEHLISLLATRLHICSVERVCDEQGGPAYAFQCAAIKVTGGGGEKEHPMYVNYKPSYI